MQCFINFFGKQGEKLEVKNEKVEFIFPKKFSRLQPFLFLPRPYYYLLCFLPRNVSKSFFSGKKLFLFSQGRVEFFLSLRLEIVVPRKGKNPFCTQGLPLLLQGIVFVLRGGESAQRASKDNNYAKGWSQLFWMLSQQFEYKQLPERAIWTICQTTALWGGDRWPASRLQCRIAILESPAISVLSQRWWQIF